MIAFKGYNRKMQCTMGEGRPVHIVGRTYEVPAAQCGRTGFHCVEEPLEVLKWHGGSDNRYCIVDAAGDIHEDGEERISCTTLKVLKEISLLELLIYECKFLEKHPNRKYSSQVQQEKGEQAAFKKFVMVRGKNPLARADKGNYIFLLKEKRDSREIEEIACYQVDEEEYKSNRWYDIDGKEVSDEESGAEED